MGKRKNNRQGKVLVLIALLMVMFLGIVAFAVDLGWIYLARTQLQSASDSGSLAGGTELIPGLGASAFRTPAEVKTRAESQAVSFVAEHPAGNATSAFIDPSRDVQMGTAAMNPATGVWTFVWDATPYNAVGVTTRRSNVGITPRDGPLPLAFARFLGTDFSNVSASSVAVIMPATGIRIPPGSGLTSGLSPFAYSLARWNKYWRARKYFEDVLGKDKELLTVAKGGADIWDNGADGDGTRLFYEMVQVGNQMVPQILFNDKYGLTDPARHDAANITTTPTDGILEINIYPYDSTSGNFGTVDIGASGNSTADLVRQILYGVSEEDMAYLPDSTLNPTSEPIPLEGDTGLSAGIKDAVKKVLGQCRSIVLYSAVDNPGNNAIYKIEEIVGVRFMFIDLTGQKKVLIVQPCSVSDGAAIPNYDEEIGEETTFFTRLILAH